jgi:hypothetical protein
VRGLMSRMRDERGISSVVVAVSMIALVGAAMLSIDAGNLWSTRRTIITGTDAGALHAAQYFNSGLGNPCNSSDQATAETGATTVMTNNHQGALHNPTDTPNGFQVTLADPSVCLAGGYAAGKVRFDGRLPSQGFFGHALGIGDTSALSSSTAAWGYIVAIGEGLRPIALCDQTPNYYSFNQWWNGTLAEADYNLLWGSDPARYPSVSSGFPQGDETDRNPNYGMTYRDPNVFSGYSVVHRITMPDAACGAVSGSRVWIDFEDEEHGTVGASALASWLRNGYKGTVALSPHDCNPQNEQPTEDCGSAPGNRATLEKALQDITCHYTIPTHQCDYVFPILVVDRIFMNGANTHYDQAGFLFVVLRGFGKMADNDESHSFDFEFVRVQTTGQIGAAPPDTSHATYTGTQLCGADHDNGGNDRCPF